MYFKGNSLGGTTLQEHLSQWAKSPKKQSVEVFVLTTWHCMSAELTKMHSFRLFFFGDFAHWVLRRRAGWEGGLYGDWRS